MQVEAEDDTAGLLGLENQPEQAAKKRRLSGPKLKKSREEVMDEEVQKLQAKLAELLDSMKDPSQPMPTAAAVSKLQRAVGGKMVEAKEAGSYQMSTQLEDLNSQLSIFKEALKATAAYLPGNGHPKKSHGDSFCMALQKLQEKFEVALRKFPTAVLGHYASLLHQKDKQRVLHICEPVSDVGQFWKIGYQGYVVQRRFGSTVHYHFKAQSFQPSLLKGIYLEPDQPILNLILNQRGQSCLNERNAAYPSLHRFQGRLSITRCCRS